MNWLGCEGLRLMQALNDTEQENCRTSTWLFEVFIENFKLQQSNNTVTVILYTDKGTE